MPTGMVNVHLTHVWVEASTYVRMLQNQELRIEVKEGKVLKITVSSSAGVGILLAWYKAAQSEHAIAHLHCCQIQSPASSMSTKI